MLVHRDAHGGVTSDDYFAGGDDVNLIIQEVSERHVKGIFDVRIKINTGPDTYDSLVITDGEFHIDRKQ